ncbi:hypothetical protein B0T11DRAFT_327384 [Plectosphaerella cucumerina]|uniref:SSCRP protein n=1 Tax=Plectosphaerella cucumerina TaxID=40658 RepID=A0A8K0TTG5_9PEZI|nr:hypothetical protein B0T11DRAFT_327384 [Plectosphaerella cucumerina]
MLSTILLALGLTATTLAHPLESRDNVQTVHLTFHGGPASYQLAIPANGQKFSTNNAISVNIIDAPDYNAIAQCTFYTDGQKALVSGITPSGLQQVIVGPPQPITAVSCEGMCVPTYGDCYSGGQFVGPCCNGFCAANKCRPWIQPS